VTEEPTNRERKHKMPNFKRPKKNAKASYFQKFKKKGKVKGK
jgi:hypothetical protein